MRASKRKRKPSTYIQDVIFSDDDSDHVTSDEDNDSDYVPSDDDSVISDDYYDSSKELKEIKITSTKKRKLPKDKIRLAPTQKTNLPKKENNLYLKLRKAFKNNNNINMDALKPPNINTNDKTCIFTTGKKNNIYSHRLIMCDDVGDIDLVFLKSILSTEMIETLEDLLKTVYEYRMQEPNRNKRTLYTGVWSKSNPMNYITKSSTDPSGQFVVNKILPKVAPIAEILLQNIDYRGYEFYLNLPPDAKKNGSIFPCSAINFLTNNTNIHRIEKPHQDNDDATSTVIFYFGKAKANLELTNQLTKFDTERGDVLIFKGKKFLHNVGKLETQNPNNSYSSLMDEMRTSLVLFGHSSLKTKPIYNHQKTEAKLLFDKEFPNEQIARAIRLEKKKEKEKMKTVGLKKKAKKKANNK